MPSREELVASYKKLLRDIIDRSPSGLRLRLAKELSTHKSFISQITNPLDPTPIPARHLPALFRLCHPTPDEERAFLSIFRVAHPNRAPKMLDKQTLERRTKQIKVAIPVSSNPEQQQAIEVYVADFARRLRDFL